MINNKKNINSQAGQTLLETIVAIFVLTTALTASLALVIYVLSNSGLNQNQIIATNLAREGVEVLRMMRDSNWLADDKVGGSYDLASCADIGNKDCYPLAHQVVAGSGAPKSYDLSTSAIGKWGLSFDPGEGFAINTTNYRLCIHGAIGYYGYSGGGPNCNGGNRIPSNFYRSIEISHTYGGAFPANDSSSNAELVIKAVVGWTDKDCPKPAASNPDPATFQCKVTVEEHLTNWKDYK